MRQEYKKFLRDGHCDDQCEKQSQYLVENNKKSVTLNKPIYGGLAILDHSKVVMSSFFYDYLKSKFGDRYELLFTDTDSFMGLVKTEDFFKEISNDVDEFFDTSNFPKDFRIANFSGKNKKVLGKFKNEMADKQITEFVGLRPKQYMFETEKKESHKKCKGISKSALKDITLDDYKNALDLNCPKIYRDMNLIRSHNHINYSETISKKVLDGFDTKRKILENGIDTVPWGF